MTEKLIFCKKKKNFNTKNGDIFTKALAIIIILLHENDYSFIGKGLC
jgi:hypothetical protein